MDKMNTQYTLPEISQTNLDGTERKELRSREEQMYLVEPRCVAK